MNEFCASGLSVLETELAAIAELSRAINDDFARAGELILSCQGRVIVMGVGKSGHIANKIAATLASTGTPAFFVHPGEAGHGDLGMITRQDVILVISYSGETIEFLHLLPTIKRYHIPMIAMTGNINSTIAKVASIHLDASVIKEACPHNLAPTASTTVALVLGDALAIALLNARGFTREDFALAHPGGILGRRLLLSVDDIMHTGDFIPRVSIDTPVKEALIEMSSKRLGMTAVVDAADHLVGVYTDGDLRRTIDKDLDLKKTNINAVMTKNPTLVRSGTLAVDALVIMKEKKINGTFVLDDEDKVIGAFNLQDLLRQGIM